ncbi:hypothetical protein ABIE51_002025 [Lysobacter sp. OAE881]
MMLSAGAHCSVSWPIRALALHAVDAVVEVLRDRIDVGRARAVGDVFRTRRARLRDRAPVVLVASERTPAIGNGGLAEAEVAFLVAARQRDAERAVGIALAEDAGDFRRDVVALQRLGDVAIGGVVHRLQAHVDHRLRFERPCGADVDRRADAAGRNVGAAGLVDLDAGDRLRRQVGEVERARVRHARAVGVARGRHLPAVEQHHVVVRPDAAHRHLRTFAQRAVDRHAADALQRFGEVGIGELADFLGHDAIHDALRVAFQVHRAGQASADALHDDGVERAGILVRRGGALSRFGGGRGLRVKRLAQCQQQCGRQQCSLGGDTQLLHRNSSQNSRRRRCRRVATQARKVSAGRLEPRVDSAVNFDREDGRRVCAESCFPAYFDVAAQRLHAIGAQNESANIPAAKKISDAAEPASTRA